MLHHSFLVSCFNRKNVWHNCIKQVVGRWFVLLQKVGEAALANEVPPTLTNRVWLHLIMWLFHIGNSLLQSLTIGLSSLVLSTLMDAGSSRFQTPETFSALPWSGIEPRNFYIQWMHCSYDLWDPSFHQELWIDLKPAQLCATSFAMLLYWTLLAFFQSVTTLH